MEENLGIARLTVRGRIDCRRIGNLERFRDWGDIGCGINFIVIHSMIEGCGVVAHLMCACLWGYVLLAKRIKLF